MLDAITGQVDRHVGNYFIERGKGNTTQVKGIDPDLSFGEKKTTTTAGFTEDNSYIGRDMYAQARRALSKQG